MDKDRSDLSSEQTPNRPVERLGFFFALEQELISNHDYFAIIERDGVSYYAHSPLDCISCEGAKK